MTASPAPSLRASPRNLAAPAPKVEPAIASTISVWEPATATPAQASEAPKVEAAMDVEPAIAGVNQVPKNISATSTTTMTSPLAVSNLRVGKEPDFEGYAAVLRGAPSKNALRKFLVLICLENERDFVTFGEVKRFVLIKDSCCFIYGFHTDPSPLYAIPLEAVYATQEDPNQLDPASVTVSPQPGNPKSPSYYVTILLKYKRDHSPAYQFTFDTRGCSDSCSTSFDSKSAAKRFLDVIQRLNHNKNAEVVTASVIRTLPADEMKTRVDTKTQRMIQNAEKAQPEI